MQLNSLTQLAILAAVTTSALAGSETASTLAPPAKSIFSGEAGITIANQYNTRGIIVQDSGTTYQPYLNLYANFFEGDGFVKSSSLFLGLWSDLSSNGKVSGPGNPGSHFTEFDYGVGLNVNFAERWSFTTFYNRWTSPADGYGDGSWVNATIAFDDSGILHDNFSFKPYVIFLRDLGGDASTGLVKNSWYIEPGIKPNYTLFADSDQPVNVGLLVKAGLGSEFYNGDTLGYVAVGPQVSLPLNFISPAAGKWNATAGYLYYHFGDQLAAANGGEDTEHLFSFNLSVGF